MVTLFYFLLVAPSCGWAGWWSPLSLILSLVGTPVPWDCCCCWAEGKVAAEDWEEEREEEDEEEEEVEEEVEEAAVGVGGAPWLVTRNSGWSWRSSSLSPALVKP